MEAIALSAGSIPCGRERNRCDREEAHQGLMEYVMHQPPMERFPKDLLVLLRFRLKLLLLTGKQLSGYRER